MKSTYLMIFSLLAMFPFLYCGSSDANESDEKALTKNDDTKKELAKKVNKNNEDNNDDGSINIENLNTPESIIYYKKEDCFLVSNINGSPVDKDENGFISKISLDGKLLEKNFIPFNDEKLDAPKGMAIKENYLYLTDIESIKVFDLENKKLVKEINLKEYGSIFLNDILVAENDKFWNENLIYVSDNMASKIFILSLDKLSYLASIDNVKGVNGLCKNPIDSEIYAVSMTNGKIVNINSKNSVKIWIDDNLGSLDGAFFDSKGNLFVSDWKESKILKISNDKKVILHKDNLSSPADFCLYEKNDKIYFLVPLFKLNKVKIIS